MLRYLSRIIICVTLLSLPALSFGQTESGIDNGRKVISRIIMESDSNVLISIPEDIFQDLFSIPRAQTKRHEGTRRSGRMSGYRIQVFSDGRNQSTLHSRAKARGNAIIARLPKYRGQVYSFSKSPNWYTQVGNFRTAGEASAALSELRRAFPGFASEMRVVRSQIFLK